MTPDISPAQCRKARALLGWSRDRLAPLVSISNTQIGKFESGRAELKLVVRTAIRSTLEAAGIEFVHGKGGDNIARLKQLDPTQN